MIVDSDSRIALDEIIAEELDLHKNDINSMTKGLEIIIPIFCHRNDERFREDLSLNKLFFDIKNAKKFPIRKSINLNGKSFKIIIYDDFHDVTPETRKEILAQYSYRIRATNGHKIIYSMYSKLI